MAKRVVKWALKGIALQIGIPPTDPKADFVMEAEFDLSKLFPGFADFNDVQKQLITFGVKQKLMDAGASEKANYGGKLTNAKTKWAELLEGKWTGERVNATGAAENKKLLSTVKEEMSKSDSLVGLILKQQMKPAEFTEADAAKLKELMAEAARQERKNGKTQ